MFSSVTPFHLREREREREELGRCRQPPRFQEPDRRTHTYMQSRILEMSSSHWSFAS